MTSITGWLGSSGALPDPGPKLRIQQDPKPASVMGRASVKGFGQVKFPGEDLILHRLLRHKFRSLLFLFTASERQD
ncbi:hypothetical protein SULPSESMR1_05029 (plasmid) [Pseudosulfitobacter pseudonitzschiae]|uniref:Uncharacterized protein n=1 Tax=Pseudosulfitobacter pseudonitzschiae TaxID=1402135 RepID=A0A221K6U8_9RHOB|nr:hypothetical protein SULPSESMR1_05029 [Pseudosulfitobacter pseudonitzschiae]